MRRCAAIGGALALSIAGACGDPYSARETAPGAGDGGDVDAGGDATVADGGDKGEGGGVDSGTCTQFIDDHFASLSEWAPIASSNGAVEYDMSVGNAAPGSLRATVAGSSTVEGEAKLQRDIPYQGEKEIQLSFALRVDAYSGTFYETGCTLELFDTNDETTYLVMTFRLADDVLEIDDRVWVNDTEASSAGATAVGTVVLQKWYQASVILTSVTSTGAHAVVSVDGTPWVAREVSIPKAPTVIRVKCGVDYADATFSGTFHIDDVKLALCK